MRRNGSERTIVIGIGSLIHSDDGAGLRALQLLARDPRLPRDVEVIDGSILGFEVISRVQDASRLLFVDAVDAGAKAGTVVRLEGAELLSLPSGTSAHDIGISGLLSLLEFLDRMPKTIALVGIQPATTEVGVWLSPEVESGLGRMVTECLRQLNEWSQVPARIERSALR